MNRRMQRAWSWIGLGLILCTGAAGAADNINFSGEAKHSGDITVKIKLVKKADGQPAGECEVTAGIVVGESAQEKATKITNALNNPPPDGCGNLVNANRTSETSNLTPDDNTAEIQDIAVTDTLDKAKVTVNDHVVAMATGTVHIGGAAGFAPEPALCSVQLPGGQTYEVSMPMSHMQGDQLEQALAYRLMEFGVPVTWDGDLRVLFGPLQGQEVALGLDISTTGAGFGPDTFVGIETTPQSPTAVEEDAPAFQTGSWGRIKSIYRGASRP